MATAPVVRSLQRAATRQVLLAIVTVALAMVALALLAEALTGGDGGTVYLAEIQPDSRAGSVPSLVAVGYGSASSAAETATVQLLFVDSEGYFNGSNPNPTADATPGAAERGAAAPIVDALAAAGVPEDAIVVVTSAAFSSGYYGPPGGSTFRIDLELSNPDLEAMRGAIDRAAQVAREGGFWLTQVGAAYGVADCRPLRDRAWEAAVADAQARAVVQAERLGVGLGDLLVSQEAIDAAANPNANGPEHGCGRAAPAEVTFGPSIVTITVPVFDPTAEPSATAHVRVSLAFEIVHD